MDPRRRSTGGPTARNEATSELVHSTSAILALPSADDPRATIFRRADGPWLVELGTELRAIVERGHLELDGIRWLLYLPAELGLVPETLKADGSALVAASACASRPAWTRSTSSCACAPTMAAVAAAAPVEPLRAAHAGARADPGRPRWRHARRAGLGRAPSPTSPIAAAQAPPTCRSRSRSRGRASPITWTRSAPNSRSATTSSSKGHAPGSIGRGGLGRVSRAHDRELGRDIAIKELISRGQLSEMRFLREALITARLEHPGIVPVYEAGRWSDGTPFYAMKLVAGRPLRDLILERTTVDGRIALLHHVIAVADAMAYAHGRNIIHRDLKPSNVIVGDFGETVVIDWGLAKDLAAAEEPLCGGGPFRTNQDDGLTSTGTILGTPAYMAPEQARGEPVNQRADVFAIGAMLWELCSLHKLPPSFSGQRRHAICRAGIDPDLATIIDKACDPDPARRYPDAGGLASDLKAFKAGARIAARRYSLWALLAHWTRRHRLVAVAMACAIVLSAASILFYVHSIRAERDQAELARRGAQQATAATAVALAKETLGHAEVLLHSDPTAAMDVLRSYRGDDRFRLGVLRAEAEGRGVARLRATPSDQAIVWIQRLSETEIASFSEDGSLAVTTTSGAVKVIPRSANAKTIWAFDARRKLFAYVCAENEICLVDLSSPSPAISAHLGYLAPEGLTFSADTQLVAVSRINDLAIWDISDIAHPGAPSAHRIRGFHAEFLDDDTLAIVDSSETAIYARLHRAAATPTPGITSVTASRKQGVIAVGSEDGSATLLHRDPRTAPHHKQLCAGPLKALTLGSADGCGRLWMQGWQRRPVGSRSIRHGALGDAVGKRQRARDERRWTPARRRRELRRVLRHRRRR